MSKYEKFSRDELLALVEKQDGELASKKYGLVWDAEREPEQVVLDCAENFPVLKRMKGKEIRTDDGEDNILIEGDNYHALTVLNYTHKEKIDVIYIDPPYNTGNKDFKYNDRFVDKEDGFRHSKWLNFMEKRLNLAKDLLKETGVIFISIDDNEQAQLKMLCDKVFGQENFVATLIWNKKNVVQNDARFFSVNHENIHCYAKNIQNTVFNLLPRTDELNARYDNPDNDSRGLWTSVALQAKSGSEANKYKMEFSNGVKWEPVQGTFPRLSKESLQKAYDEGRLWFGKGGKNVPRLKKYLNEVKQGVISNSILLPNDIGSTQLAKETIKKILGSNDFETPKPVDLIKRFIILNSASSGIVLDFFAGSGTTGHAVLELNKEDGGNRKFILCTNNEVNGLERELREKGMSDKEIQEYGICRRVTYPRIQKVIKGYKKNGDGEKVEGLGGNLQYFKTDLVKDSKNSTQVRIDVSQKCAEMLCVRENIFNAVTEQEEYKIFASNKKDVFLCVYFSYMETSFDEFLKEIKKLKGKKIIYVFSPDEEADKRPFVGILDCVIETIPEKILKEYRRLAKINIPIKAETIFIELEKAQKKIFEEKDKDDGARVLRIVLAKTVQKIAQKNGVSILKENKGEKTAILNDVMYHQKIFNKVQWEENKTCLAIGNNASHGEYEDYDLKQVENFYQHIRSLLNDFEI